MRAESFNYRGYTFKPVGNILGGCWGYISTSYTLEIEGYTHEDFYKEAKKHHASCDIYEVNGKLFIPCTKVFMGISGNYEKGLKRIEEYSRWYH